MIEKFDVERSDALISFAEEAGANAQTVIYLVRNESEAVAAFVLADVVREESRRAVEALHAMDIEVAMLTVDSEDVAKAVAEERRLPRTWVPTRPAWATLIPSDVRLHAIPCLVDSLDYRPPIKLFFPTLINVPLGFAE